MPPRRSSAGICEVWSLAVVLSFVGVGVFDREKEMERRLFLLEEWCLYTVSWREREIDGFPELSSLTCLICRLFIWLFLYLFYLFCVLRTGNSKSRI